VNKKPDARVEKDRLGEAQLPAGAYWGVRTARARDLLAISGLQPHPRLVEATVMVKKAAALAHGDSGRLERPIASAISQAADEVLSGQWRDQFVIDPFQCGAGAAHNSNVNEVLANRALEILGAQPGAYGTVHPELHVNLSQSAHDVFPTAMRIAILTALKEFEPVILDLERLLRRKSLEFDKVLKTGRTHLRDAAPITLGQEFNAYGSSIERSSTRIKDAAEHLLTLNIGAGTVGTGLNVEPTFVAKVIEALSQQTGLRFRSADEYFRISQSAADFLQVSSSLKELAVELIKIASDIRLLSSGPMSGLGEINLPSLMPEPSAVLPGVLPDRTDPGVAECLTMVAYQVVGNDTAVTLAAGAGQLELNVMTPLIIHNILQSLDLLRQAILAFNKWCVAGITANAARCRELLDKTVMSVLALTPHLGYERVTALARESLECGRTIRELVLDQGLMTPQEVDLALKQKLITQPGLIVGTASDTTSGTA